MGGTGTITHSHRDDIFDSPQPPQEVLLTVLLRVALIAGIPALIPGVIASIQEGLLIVATADILAYLSLLPIYFGRRRSHAIAASLFCGVLLTLGTVLLVYIGPVSAAMLVLVMPPILAGLLLGRRACTVIWVLTILPPVIITVALYLDLLRWTVPLTVWFTLVASFLLVAIALSVSIRFLLRRLLEALHHERVLNESLRISNREKEALLQEIHHRVRNNMQMVNSLLSLQKSIAQGEETHRALEMMRGRVSAMAISYNYLEIDGAGLLVDLRSVVEAIAQDVRQSLGSSVEVLTDSIPLRFPLERVTIIALAVTEVLWNCPGCTGLSLSRRDGVRDEDRDDLLVVFDLPSDPAAADTFSSPVTEEILAALTEQAGGHCAFPVVTIPI
jgi:signal transduction histidine kinase